MKLDNWTIDAFGHLENFSVDGLAAQPLVVVAGENESGKSTLFEFLICSLYGVAPARLADHPYAPWSGKPIDGRVGFQLGDGTAVAVQRRLGRSVRGKLRIGDQDEDIANDPLPWTGALTREVYRGLHALTVDELVSLNAVTWALFEERLLGGTSFEFLRPAREALADIEKSALELWRPGARRGGLHGRLAAEIRRQHREREQADGRANRILALRGELTGKQSEIDAAEQTLREVQSRLLRAEVLLPVISTLEEIETLRKQAERALPEDEFPDDPRARLTQLDGVQADKGTAKEALETEIEQLEQKVARSDEHGEIIALEDEVRALVRQAAVHQQDVVHLNDIDRSRGSHESVLVERCGQLFDGTLDGSGRDTVAKIDMTELQSRVKAWDEARRAPQAATDQVRQAKEAVKLAEKDLEELPPANEATALWHRARDLRTLQSRDTVLREMKKELESDDKARSKLIPKNDNKRLGIGLVAAGITLLVVLLTGGTTSYWLVGLITLGLIGGGIAVFKRKQSESNAPYRKRVKQLETECKKLRKKLELHEYESPETPLQKTEERLTLSAARPTLEKRLVNARYRVTESEQKAKAVGEQVNNARKEVAALLDGLSVTKSRLAKPGQDLVTDIEAVRATLREVARLTAEHDAITKRAAEREEAAQELADKLDMEMSGEPMDIAPLCQERLHRARTARRQASEATEELPRMRERLDALAEQWNTARDEQEQLQTRLSALDLQNGDVRAGLDVLEQARSRRRNADEMEAQLHTSCPDWEARGAEARAARELGLDLDLPTEDKVALRQQIDQWQATLLQLGQDKGRLDQEFGQLQQDRELSDVDGALSGLRAQERRLLRRRDQLALLANIVREAEARWREEYQPAVVTRASEHLETLTGGRYEHLSVEGRQLYVQPTDNPYPVAVGHPLSRGVREQIHLALRLAMAESMDGDEAMPLLLDDVFACWDDDRIRNGARLLQSLSEERQVFVFTSQPQVALQLAGETGARVVQTPGSEMGKDAPAPKSVDPKSKQDAPKASVS